VPEGASVLSPCALEGSDPSAETRPEIESILLSCDERSGDSPDNVSMAEPVSTWRGELANRLEAYRFRRTKISPDAAQTRLPFTEPVQALANPGTMAHAAAAVHAVVNQTGPIGSNPGTLTLEEPPAAPEEEFAFTIAIGRIASERPRDDSRLMIDVSCHANDDAALGEAARGEEFHGAQSIRQRLYPVADMSDRRLAGAIDLVCLGFACGGFLALFGSLGGHFTLSKLSVAISVSALAIVYLQYFALFTIFGGTTPGMMFRGLQVMSFSGDAPTPRQMFLRSVGYVVSAATCFMGFLWAVWDEDELTWHDRFSKTHLTSAQTYAEVESHSTVHPH